MQKKGLVSVIISTLNRPSYLIQAVQSVMAQTYPDIELIIVDDGSENGGEANREILKPYLSSLTYTYQENQGIGGAVNKGLSLAKGEFIQRLDDDDTLAEEKIEKSVKVFKDNPSVGLVATGYHVTDESGNITSSQKPLHYPEDARLLFMLMAIISAQAAVIVRSSCHDEVGVYRTDIVAEDYEMWLRIARKFEIATIDEPLVFYRRHGGNITNLKNMERFERDTSQFMEYYLEEMPIGELIPGIKSEACGYILKAAVYLLHDGRFVRTVGIAQEKLNKALELAPDEPLIRLWELVTDIHRDHKPCPEKDLSSFGEFQEQARLLIGLKEELETLKASRKPPSSPEMTSFRGRYTRLRGKLIMEAYRRTMAG